MSSKSTQTNSGLCDQTLCTISKTSSTTPAPFAWAPKKILFALLVFSLAAPGCIGRRVNHEETDSPVDAKESESAAAASSSSAASTTPSSKDALTENMSAEQKIQTLNSALSRAQSRIEELDAKVSSLTDKLESTKLTVDNIAGTQASVPTQVVGEAASHGSAAIAAAAVAEAAHESASNKPNDHEAEIISEFRSAQQLFKTGKYSDAVLAFNGFASSHSDHILAGSAQYQAGEAYLQMGEIKLALAEFGKVISSFPTSPRVPTSLVRIAHCYKLLGNTVESGRTLALAQDLYPENPSLDLIPPTASVKNGSSELQTAPMEN